MLQRCEEAGPEIANLLCVHGDVSLSLGLSLINQDEAQSLRALRGRRRLVGLRLGDRNSTGSRPQAPPAPPAGEV